MKEKKTLFQKLKEYHNTMLPMHMPGHKRNLALSGTDGYLAALCADCDITEIAGFDNLAEPEGIFLSLKERAAALWKSEEAYPLVNGSTCGVLAAIYATVPYGGSVIVARNCHKSVYNGLQLVNAKVTYLLPEWEETLGCYGDVSCDTVKKALDEVPDAKLVIITSPTYEGILSDIERICKTAHEKKIPVLVDSAHGAHLGFGDFPKGAVECGADLVVHSLHKTLPCLTQTAMLHRRGKLVSGEALQTAINMFQTSSPSYLLLASIEGCIGLLEERGGELFAGWQEALSGFYEEVKGLRYLSVNAGGETKENTCLRESGKLVISTMGANLSGPELMGRLREEYRIELEMAAERYGLAMTGMGDTKDSLQHLADALKEVDKACISVVVEKLPCPAIPAVRMTIGEAMGAECKEKPLAKAIGEIAAEHIWAYPPGIPVVVAGEEITEATVAYLTEKRKQGVELHRKSGTCKGEIFINIVTSQNIAVDKFRGFGL